jgi:hypothetical protein
VRPPTGNLHGLCEDNDRGDNKLLPTAYKGIPLVTVTVDKLAELGPKKFANICYSFNKKKTKDHDEGGTIVGARLRGKKVLIIDNAVIAGTAKREAIDQIQKERGYSCWYHGGIRQNGKATSAERRRQCPYAQRYRRDQERIWHPFTFQADSQRHNWRFERAWI